MTTRQPDRPGLILYSHPNDEYFPPRPPPAKYNAEVHAEIVKLIRSGFSPDNAARASGIAAPTFANWLSRGRDGDVWLADFYADVDQALAEANLRNEQAIKDGLDVSEDMSHGDKIKRAELALKIQERKDSKNWNKEIRITVEAQMSAFLERCMTDPRLTDVVPIILEIAAGATGPAAFAGAEEGEE